MNIVNLTPHTITVLVSGEIEHEYSFPPSGQVARVSVKNAPDGDINGIPVSKPIYGEVEGLPAPEPGVIYIVSMLVGQRCPGRSDIIGPDSGPSAIRENGQIKAVRGFVRF